MFWGLLDPDPDTLVTDTNQAVSGSGYFYHQAIVRKTLIPTVLTIFDFVSLKNGVNVPLKSNKHKNFFWISFLLASWRSMTKIAGSGTISQRYGSADPDPYKNVTDPQHWLKGNLGALLIWLTYLHGCEVGCAVIAPDDEEHAVVRHHARVPPAVVHLRRRWPSGIIQISVADPGCLSRIPDPNIIHSGSEFLSSRIPDPHQII
jgi:hypothetical protein